MTNRIDEIFLQKKKVLSIYFTAGYPQLNDTIPILEKLQKAGVDLVEIGLPFSDPLADGPTIQKSSNRALVNGMSSEVLFDQLKGIRKKIKLPLVLMGYFNPILQYGVAKFCESCAEVGIDGIILPDLPLEVYQQQYKSLFKEKNLYNILLITPQTPENRIREIDNTTNGFVYMVSSNSITGAKHSFGTNTIAYFERIKNLKLKSPQLIGFGISNHRTFKSATKHAHGGIIGSAFINFLATNPINEIGKFIKSIREGVNQ